MSHVCDFRRIHVRVDVPTLIHLCVHRYRYMEMYTSIHFSRDFHTYIFQWGPPTHSRHSRKHI